MEFTMLTRFLIVATLPVLLGITAVPQLAAPPVRAGDVVITGGFLFDSVRDTAVPNRGIVIRSGIFHHVGLDLANVDLTGATVIKLPDTDYVLPGFFDLHAHYAIDLFGQGRVDEYTVNPVIFLANGVTSTFPAGEVDPEGMMAARRRIERGEQIGARILSSGPYFGSARPGWNAAVNTPEQVRKDVDEWAARGARGFKAKGIQAPHLLALIEQAHKHGLPVTGHLDSGSRGSVNPRDAIYMGIDRIEHFMGGDAITADRGAYSSLEALDVMRPEVEAISKLYIQRNVYYDATVSAYGYWYNPKDMRIFTTWVDEQSFLTPHAKEVANAPSPRGGANGGPRRPQNAQFERIYNVKLKEIKRFYDLGGARLITSGTDHPSWGEYLSGFGTHRELNAFVLAGIPPAAAIKMATINAAHAMRMSDILGTIEPGKLADLVIVRGNPLQDIKNSHNVQKVMIGGTVHDAPALLNSVKGKMGPATAADDDWWKGNVRLGGGRGGGVGR
jgi:imidazolonepropionase-like amidohydrolase